MDTPRKVKVTPDDLDDCLKFIAGHREEIARGTYDIHLERDWAKVIDDEDLVVLARECPGARLAIAAVSKSFELLELLTGDSSGDVREAVADNPRTPARALGLLSDDHVPAVRMAVAGNASTASPHLEKLASDPVNYVRWAVAHNENTPPGVLERLMKDADRHISDEARRNPNAPKRGLLARLFKRG